MMSAANRYLVVYSFVVTATLAMIVLTGATSIRKKTAFDEIDVHRINVVESDGTLRMVISNHGRLPGVFVGGKETPLDRPQAGMIFLNDDGSETGGLIFGGHKNEKGEIVDSGASLSFDRYGANQIVQLIGVHDREDRMAGLAISDSNPGGDGHRRLWFGRCDDNNSSVALMDANGKKRIVMKVTAEGTSSIEFLDSSGRVVDSVGGAKSSDSR